MLSVFPEYLKEDRVNDALFELGELVKNPDLNIIKLPNISKLCSSAQKRQCRVNQGIECSRLSWNPSSEEENKIQARYNKVKGSVNPVLREGNSDRRPKAVKNYKDKSSLYGRMEFSFPNSCFNHEWRRFFHNEKSVCVEDATNVKIEFVSEEGNFFVLKDSVPLLSNEIIDASVMSKKSLLSFLEREIKDAKESGILLSLHMKATMMKVSDPIIFSYVVKVFFSDLIDKHSKIFEEIGVDFKNGFGDLISKIQTLPTDTRKQIERDIEIAFENNAKQW